MLRLIMRTTNTYKKWHRGHFRIFRRPVFLEGKTNNIIIILGILPRLVGTSNSNELPPQLILNLLQWLCFKISAIKKNYSPIP